MNFLRELIYSIFKEVVDLYKFRWVCFSYVNSTLKLRYRRSVLGFFWSLLGPTLNYLMVGIVFSFALKSKNERFFLYFFSGTAIFNLFSVIANASPGLLLVNESYIKKIYLPKTIFILNNVLMEFVNFLLALAALIVIGMITGYLSPTWSFLILPIPIFLTLVFATGIACLLSTATVFFRDFFNIVPIVVQGMFFCSPILYSIEMVPEKYQKFILLNPMYYFIEFFRTLVYSDSLPSLHIMAMSLGLCGASLLVGLVTLKVLDNDIIFRL